MLSILKMENANCKSLVLRWCTLILYPVGYRYLSSSLPFLCHTPRQAQQLPSVKHISLTQDGKFFASQHYLAKGEKCRALPQDAQRRAPRAEAGGSTVPRPCRIPNCSSPLQGLRLGPSSGYKAVLKLKSS